MQKDSERAQSPLPRQGGDGIERAQPPRLHCLDPGRRRTLTPWEGVARQFLHGRRRRVKSTGEETTSVLPLKRRTRWRRGRKGEEDEEEEEER